MSIVQSLYDKNKYFRSFAQKLGFGRPINVELLSSRLVEYPWTLSNFPFASAHKVLDVGSCGSQLPIMLAGMGLNVWTLDIRKYEYADLSSNLHSVCGDITKTDFSDGFFDVVTAISTIEHIGLGRYGDAVDSEGDKDAIREIKRITSNGGTLLITVPFGKSCLTPAYRVYDKSALLSLFKDFTIKSMDFFMNTGKLWTKAADENQVKNLDSSTKEMATACLRMINT